MDHHGPVCLKHRLHTGVHWSYGEAASERTVFAILIVTENVILSLEEISFLESCPLATSELQGDSPRTRDPHTAPGWRREWGPRALDGSDADMQSVPGQDRRPNQWDLCLRGRGPPGQVALPLMTLNAPPSTLGPCHARVPGARACTCSLRSPPGSQTHVLCGSEVQATAPRPDPLSPAYLPLCRSAQAVLPKAPRGLESDWRVPLGSGTPGAPARPCSARTCTRPTPRQTPGLAECVIPTCGEPDLTGSPRPLPRHVQAVFPDGERGKPVRKPVRAGSLSSGPAARRYIVVQ